MFLVNMRYIFCNKSNLQESSIGGFVSESNVLTVHCKGESLGRVGLQTSRDADLQSYTYSIINIPSKLLPLSDMVFIGQWFECLAIRRAEF